METSSPAQVSLEVKESPVRSDRDRRVRRRSGSIVRDFAEVAGTVFGAVDAGGPPACG